MWKKLFVGYIQAACVVLLKGNQGTNQTEKPFAGPNIKLGKCPVWGRDAKYSVLKSVVKKRKLLLPCK